MRKYVLVFVLLTSSPWMMAQSAGQSSGSRGTTGTQNGNNLEGCLTGSKGDYILTDDTGNAYQLMGDQKQLNKYLGERVRSAANWFTA
jgi:hypothetical protein